MVRVRTVVVFHLFNCSTFIVREKNRPKKRGRVTSISYICRKYFVYISLCHYLYFISLISFCYRKKLKIKLYHCFVMIRSFYFTKRSFLSNLIYNALTVGPLLWCGAKQDHCCPLFHMHWRLSPERNAQKENTVFVFHPGHMNGQTWIIITTWIINDVLS